MASIFKQENIRVNGFRKARLFGWLYAIDYFRVVCNTNVACKPVRHFTIYIPTILILTFFTKCTSTTSTNKQIEQEAIDIANNIDSTSLNLLRKYCYGSRGDDNFWQRISADTNLYTCSYKTKNDTSELTIFQPFSFKNDFATSYIFDTTSFFRYKFSELGDEIVKITATSDYQLDYYKDTSALVKSFFTRQDPFETFADLTKIKARYKFIGTSYRSDIGDFIIFWLSPQYKLTYLPDTLKMNEKSKKYWLDDFAKGKEIKPHWSLQKVHD